MASDPRVARIVEAVGKMLWGSIGEVYRRCGRPNCRCAQGEKHGPVYYLQRSEGGRTRNIYIPEDLREQVERGVAAYRRYRELGQEIAEQNARGLGLGKKRRGRRAK
ncbi:MAG: DUF6788 family protein [Candidatus Binatia bacterium]